MKKSKSLTNEFVRLYGVYSKILELLKVNPTSKYVNQKIGKNKKFVSVYLNRLIHKGYIKRLDWGYYKVLNTCQPVPHFPTKSNNLATKNPYVLHNLQIKLFTTALSHKIIKNYVSKLEYYYNSRNDSIYIDLGLKWCITKDNIFLYFPSEWSLKASDPHELSKILYDVIEQAVNKAERRFKICLFKDNRINFEITNLHIAYRDNGVAKVLTDHNVKYVLVRDSEDNKGRFVIDLSKGYPEPEFIHPIHAIDDSHRWHWLATELVKGNLEQIPKDIKEIRSVILQLAEKTLGLKYPSDVDPIDPKQQKDLKDYIG